MMGNEVKRRLTGVRLPLPPLLSKPDGTEAKGEKTVVLPFRSVSIPAHPRWLEEINAPWRCSSFS